MEPQVIQVAAMEPNLSQAAPIHVLFVEDEFLISEWVAQSLSEQGFSVQAVSNAADALRALVIGEMEHAAELSVPLVVDVGVGANWVDAKSS